ncbi:Sporulation sigma-E factor-processing peptidase [Sporomusa silvacetica DSM 10669]|uniref:Sporulation sigma-E factor-processing peptidase n=1 Tax=Sporomusa silvacetica DSM 10669 TaxID=1123289 RepID=A0ABZ3IK27_9FIRM|nr:sigma-E processing peptidase SpoIIGA [Sporomusa silvacetica]OZC17287.1 sporulation sigma-E factor-processing peptidase [Sporomusa silvacetica DSM 10669]
MSIYADVVLLINFIMNSIILVVTAYAAGISFCWKRLLMTAVAGGVYTLVGIFPEMAIFYSIPGKFLASVVIILLAFGYRSVKLTVTLTGIFFMVSFILGGALLGWMYFIQTEAPYRAGTTIKLSWGNLVAGSVIAIVLILLVVKRLLARMYRYKTFYQARIEYAGQLQEITGMMDTGNGLYSLLGRKPVVLLSLQSALQLLGRQVAVFLTANRPDSWLANLDKCQDSAWLARVEIIPCQSVGGCNMLLGFRPDSITVMSKVGSFYTSEVLIGIYDGTFADGSDCQALLHPALITEINMIKEESTCELPGQ